MDNPISFLFLVAIAVAVWAYGMFNTVRMNRNRASGAPRWALNPYAGRYLTPQGMRYRRRALVALAVFLVLVAIELSPLGWR